MTRCSGLWNVNDSFMADECNARRDEGCATTGGQTEYLIGELQNRSATIGSYHFESVGGLRAWIGKYLPRLDFGLYVDGVSIFAFFLENTSILIK